MIQETPAFVDAGGSALTAQFWSTVAKSERLVLDPGDHQSPGSVAQIPLRSREELFEQFF